MVFNRFFFLFSRKIILEYFGDDTSSLEIRNDCCDNCANGLSSTRLSDLYVGVDNAGNLNFELDAQILLGAIKSIETNGLHPVPKTIINLLRGRNLQALMNSPLYGKGRARKPYYWNAFIDQLIFTDYIDLVAGKTYMKISEKGQRWLERPGQKTLRLKAIGSMNRFFKPKPRAPVEQWSNHYIENKQIRGITMNQYDDSYFDFIDNFFQGANYY